MIFQTQKMEFCQQPEPDETIVVRKFRTYMQNGILGPMPIVNTR